MEEGKERKNEFLNKFPFDGKHEIIFDKDNFLRVDKYYYFYVLDKDIDYFKAEYYLYDGFDTGILNTE